MLSPKLGICLWSMENHWLTITGGLDIVFYVYAGYAVSVKEYIEYI